MKLLLFDDFTGMCFPDGSLRHKTADAAGRIDLRVPPDHGARIQYGVAADFHMVSQHGAEFFQTGLNVLFPGMHFDKRFVALHIACDGTGTHMAVVAENRVADIVVMRHLHMIEQNDILQFNGVADNTVRTDKRAAADKCTVAHFGIGPDNARRTEICGRKYLGVLCTQTFSSLCSYSSGRVLPSSIIKSLMPFSACQGYSNCDR